MMMGAEIRFAVSFRENEKTSFSKGLPVIGMELQDHT